MQAISPDFLDPTEMMQLRSMINYRLIEMDRQKVPSNDDQSHKLEYGQLLTIDQKLTDRLIEMGHEV
ncbi:hypothetical protein N9L28_05740 [Luminiphilus sp.]|nr:hypothetical protein [Luminiphilus sp.]